MLYVSEFCRGPRLICLTAGVTVGEITYILYGLGIEGSLPAAVVNFLCD